MLIDGLVEGRTRNRVKHTYRSGQRRLKVCQHERQCKIGLVVHDQVLLADTITKLDNFGPLAIHPNAFVLVLAKNERFPVLEDKLMFRFNLLIAQFIEGAVIKNITVLQNLHVGRATMSVRPLKRIAKMLLLHVYRAADETGVRAERNRDRIEREIDRSRGR